MRWRYDLFDGTEEESFRCRAESQDLRESESPRVDVQPAAIEIMSEYGGGEMMSGCEVVVDDGGVCVCALQLVISR